MSDSVKIPIPLRDVACQDLITDTHIIHHGNLRRRGMLNNLAEMVNVRQLKLSKVIRWRQSYVVLHGGCIYIYDNEMSTRPVRATSLYGFTGIEPCGQEVSKGVSWPFKLVCALQEKDRIYYFSAPSEKDLKVWITCIEDQMLSIFRANERSVPTALVSPQPHGAKGGNLSRPPLPPPREAEYVLKEDDEDDELPGDYTEIDDEALDVMKMNKKELSKVQNVSAINNQPPAVPTSSKPNKFQPTPTGKVAPTVIPPKITPKPKGIAAVTMIKSANMNTGSQSGSSDSARLEDNIEYFGAPQYLDLADDSNLESRREGIPPEAYWNGKPDEADELMKTLNHNGAYMVRDSSERGAQTLIVRVDSSVVKYKIQVNEKGHIGLMASGPHFESMAKLIAFYMSSNVPRHSSPLTLPYSRVQKA